MKSVAEATRTGASSVQPWTSPADGAKPAVWERFWGLPLDLVLTLIWAFLGVAAVLLDMPTTPRVVFGLPLLFFLPGYALTSALFPRLHGPDGIERIGLGLGLSLATLPAVALALQYSSLSVSTTEVTVSLAGVCVVAVSVSLRRRQKLPVGDQYRVAVNFPTIPNPGRWDRSIQITAGVMALSILVLAAGALPVVLNRLAGDQLTEFALFTEEGAAGFYPRDLTVGEPAVVELGVTNREGETVSYALAITGAGYAVDTLPTITLEDGETWRQSVQFAIAEEGDDLPVRFELRRTDESKDAEPYRTLQLMVDGRASDVNASG